MTHALKLDGDHAAMTIGLDQIQATSGALRRQPSQKSAYESLKTDASSFSSVSSFADVSAGSRTRAKKGGLTPRPFFWRSHPSVTVTSYHQDPSLQKTRVSTHSPIRKVVPKLAAVPSNDNFPNFSDHPHRQQPQTHQEDEVSAFEGDSDRDYAPYLHPAVVRKLWNEHQPMQLKVNSNWNNPRSVGESHPQGPPAVRSNNPLVQSLASFAGVFQRNGSR